MLRLRWLAMCLVLGLSACEQETLNIGGPIVNRFVLTGVAVSNTAPLAGEPLTATINFQGVNGPFTFTVTFADCVTPAVQTVSAPTGATSAQLEFTLDEFTTSDDPDGKDCTITVTGVDANGSIGTVSGAFHVEGSDV